MQLILCRGNVTTVFSRLSQYLSGWELQPTITQDLENSSARCWREESIYLSYLKSTSWSVCWPCCDCVWYVIPYRKLGPETNVMPVILRQERIPSLKGTSTDCLLMICFIADPASNKPFCTWLPLMNCEIVAQDWTPVSVHSWTILQEGSIRILCAGFSLSKAEISSNIISQSSILHFLWYVFKRAQFPRVFGHVGCHCVGKVWTTECDSYDNVVKRSRKTIMKKDSMSADYF